jgi:alanine racemase
MANSAALFTSLRPLYDTVRPGISAYGILNADLPGSGELKPVLSLRTQIVFLKDVPAGTPIGYSSTWRAERPTRIATLPVGYHDGVPWRLSNCGEVLVRGRRAPIVGRVTMDYITIDVGHIPGAAVGDTATLIGSDGHETITVEEVAQKAGTIAYEVTCSVGRRVQRLYLGGENLELASQRAPDVRTPAPLARRPLPREAGRELPGG